MHRPGADQSDMQIADFLCDFCRRPWDGTFPMVEGHQGALICDRCLTVAAQELLVAKQSSTPADYACTLCLEERDQPGWQSPLHEESRACKRCINQAAARLHKDPDCNWQRPQQ